MASVHGTMLAKVRAVVFDLDGTLLDRRGSFEHFLRKQWKRFSPLAGNIEEDRYVETLIELDRDGYAPRHELFAGMAVRFGLPAELAEELLADYRTGFPAACFVFPDVRRTLSSLRASGLKLGLITNGSVRMQTGKLQCLALAPAFDAVLISDAEGIAKPDPRIFQLALDRLEVEPSEAAYVGDNPEVDIAGARAAGMVAVWRRDVMRAGMIEADAIIDEMGDLLALLGLPPGD